MNENLECIKNQVILARTEIKNLRQQLTALRHENSKEVSLIKSILGQLLCTNCADIASTLVVPDREPSQQPTCGINYQPIGIIHTSFQNKKAVPRQPCVLAKAKGTIIIDKQVYNNPEHALIGLQDFSHMWIIFHFHSRESTNVPAKISPPRLDGERCGVFSTRSPHRPCPIGLSLVKIMSIEGNKIHFQGVDMINGTPVLDIKPYIPQYDCPLSVRENSVDNGMSSLQRPPTEGVSDATKAVSNMNVDDTYQFKSLSPRLINPVGIEINSSISTFDDNINSLTTDNLSPLSSSTDSPSSVDLLEVNFEVSPTQTENTERGAPDGQERFTPPQSALVKNQDGVRVAPWISNPTTQTYEVCFTDDAYQRLKELIGERAEGFKCNIQSLLSEDPRSCYVRNRYPDHEYCCVLEDLSISCVFDANSSVCTILAVRSAEELQLS